MNKRLVIYLLGYILLIEAACMLPGLGIALLYGDGDALPITASILIIAAFALPMRLLSRPQDKNLRAKEGFAVVALSWALMSVFGGAPYMLSGMIPSFTDALFESASGFTTTGATILTDFYGLPRGIMFWRSFTHWIGGMGVLVLTLALLPQMTGRASHLVRAESTGTSLTKIVPKMGESAKILYLIYAALTVVTFFALMAAGMSPYDAAIHAMSTAGTGGFSNYGNSIAAFDSAVIDWVITFFMLLYGVNFALFYRLINRDWRSVVKSEELRWFGVIVLVATALVTAFILPVYNNLGAALRYGAFQVASVISTTGFMTADFNLWSEPAKMVLLFVMLIGSCAGSTAGGLKVVRFATLCKQTRREIRRSFQPRKVQVVRFEGKGVEENMLQQTAVFAFDYVAMIILCTFLVSLDGIYGFEENITAALTCISNVGPGLGAVGPASNFAGYSGWSKVVLSLLMLAGRLELFPILALFHPALYKKG